MSLLFTIVIMIVVFVVVLRSVHVVPQTQVRIIERLGRFSHSIGPGMHVLVPVVDHVRAAVDVREQVVALPPHETITSDRRVLLVTLELRSAISDPVRATYEVADVGEAVAQLTRTTLDERVGALTAEEVVTDRAALALEVRRVLVKGAAAWGVQVHDVTVLDVVRSPNQRSIA